MLTFRIHFHLSFAYNLHPLGHAGRLVGTRQPGEDEGKSCHEGLTIMNMLPLARLDWVSRKLSSFILLQPLTAWVAICRDLMTVSTSLNISSDLPHRSRCIPGCINVSFAHGYLQTCQIYRLASLLLLCTHPEMLYLTLSVMQLNSIFSGHSTILLISSWVSESHWSTRGPIQSRDMFCAYWVVLFRQISSSVSTAKCSWLQCQGLISHRIRAVTEILRSIHRCVLLRLVPLSLPLAKLASIWKLWPIWLHVTRCAQVKLIEQISLLVQSATPGSLAMHSWICQYSNNIQNCTYVANRIVKMVWMGWYQVWHCLLPSEFIHWRGLIAVQSSTL